MAYMSSKATEVSNHSDFGMKRYPRKLRWWTVLKQPAFLLFDYNTYYHGSARKMNKKFKKIKISCTSEAEIHNITSILPIVLWRYKKSEQRFS